MTIEPTDSVCVVELIFSPVLRCGLFAFMHGVTAAIVAFIFVCVVFPNIVRVKAQFYAALGMICASILLDALGVMISGWTWQGFRVFAYAAVAGLQIGSIVMLFLACGGLSWNELTDEMRDALETIRRGDSKSIIVPLTGEQPKPREEKAPDRLVIPVPEDAPSLVKPITPNPPNPQNPKPDPGPVPLE